MSLVFTVEVLAESEVPPLPPPLVAVGDPVADALAVELVTEESPLEPVVVAPEAVELSNVFDTPVVPVFVVLMVASAPLSPFVAESSDEQPASSIAPAHVTNL